MYLQFYCNQVDHPHSPEDGRWHDYCGWDRSCSQSVGGNSEDHDWNWLGRLHCSMAPQHCLLQSTVCCKSLNLYYFVFLSGSSVCSGLGGQQVPEQNGDQCSWRAEEDHEGCEGRRWIIIIFIIKSLHQFSFMTFQMRPLRVLLSTWRLKIESQTLDG